MGSSSWLCHIEGNGEVTGYTPPGVALDETDGELTFGWRRAVWTDRHALTGGEPPEVVEPLRFSEVLAEAPEDWSGWAFRAMEAHLGRLRWYTSARPGDRGRRPPGVERAAYALRVLQQDYDRARESSHGRARRAR